MLNYYEYYPCVEERWAELDRMAAQYRNISEWKSIKEISPVCWRHCNYPSYCSTRIKPIITLKESSMAIR